QAARACHSPCGRRTRNMRGSRPSRSATVLRPSICSWWLWPSTGKLVADFAVPGCGGLAEGHVDVLEAFVTFGLGIGDVGTLVCRGEFHVVGERGKQGPRP